MSLTQVDLMTWDATRHQVLTLNGHGWCIGVMSDADRGNHGACPPGGKMWDMVNGPLARYFRADLIAALRWDAERVVCYWYGRSGYFIRPQIERLQQRFPETEFVSEHCLFRQDGDLVEHLMHELKRHAVTRRTCFIVPREAQAFVQMAGRIGFEPQPA